MGSRLCPHSGGEGGQHRGDPQRDMGRRGQPGADWVSVSWNVSLSGLC